MKVRLEKGEAAREEDRVRILNAVVGCMDLQAAGNSSEALKRLKTNPAHNSQVWALGISRTAHFKLSHFKVMFKSYLVMLKSF